jgi:O-antigen ligase
VNYWNIGRFAQNSPPKSDFSSRDSIIKSNSLIEVDTIVKYRQFFIMLILWIILSIVAGPVNIAFVAICAIILKSREKYTEMLMGLWVVCTLSDNRLSSFASFEQAKYLYIILLSLFFLLDLKKFKPTVNLYLRFLPFIIVAFYCLRHSPSLLVFDSFSKTLSYFLLLLIVPNYVIKSYRENGYDFMRLFIYVAVFILILGFVFKVFNPIAASLEGRYRGLLGNPNGLGLYCAVVFIFFALIIRTLPDLFHRQEKILIYTLIFASLILCGSRTSIAAILIYIMFSYLTRISTVLGFIILIAMLMGYEYIDVNIITFVKSFGGEKYFRTETIENAAGRFVAWKFAWDNISKDIFMGHGFEYTNNLFFIHQKELNDLGHQGNAHNSFLTFWLDTGLIGIMLYLWALIATFIKAARKNKVVVAAMFAILFAGFFESYLTSSLNPYTLVVFMILTIFTNDEILPIQAQAIIPLH